MTVKVATSLASKSAIPANLYTEIACQRSCMGAVARLSRIGLLFDPRAGSHLMQWTCSGAVAMITANLCDPETRWFRYQTKSGCSDAAMAMPCAPSVATMTVNRRKPYGEDSQTHRCQIVTLSDFKSAEGASPEFDLAQGSHCASVWATGVGARGWKLQL
jgi:hypothetical protein